MRNYRLGYDPDRVLYAFVNTRGYRPTPAEQTALNQRMLEAARGIPGVSHATQAASVPFWGNEGVAGSSYLASTRSTGAGASFSRPAAPTTSRRWGTRILRGRAFDETDREGTAHVVVVSEGMAPSHLARSRSGRRRLRQDWRPGSALRHRDRHRRGRCASASSRMRASSAISSRHGSTTVPLDPQLFVRVTGDPASLVETLRRPAAGRAAGRSSCRGDAAH